MQHMRMAKMSPNGKSAFYSSTVPLVPIAVDGGERTML